MVLIIANYMKSFTVLFKDVRFKTYTSIFYGSQEKYQQLRFNIFT